MAKPLSVFILTSTDNPESGKEYDSIFVSVPSRRVNFLHVVILLHHRLLIKSEPTYHFISPDTTPQAVVILLHPRLLIKSEPTYYFISPDTTPPAVVKAFVST